MITTLDRFHLLYASFVITAAEVTCSIRLFGEGNVKRRLSPLTFEFSPIQSWENKNLYRLSVNEIIIVIYTWLKWICVK